MANEYISISESEYKIYLDNLTRMQILIDYYKHSDYISDNVARMILGIKPKPSTPIAVVSEVTADPEEEPKKNTGIVPKKKDLGRLRSLLDAGWTQNKIADEFRVSPATISTWKKELDNE